MRPPSIALRTDKTLIADLRELVAAIDRRVPRAERVGERAIALDAAQLKTDALARIARISGARGGTMNDFTPQQQQRWTTWQRTNTLAVRRGDRLATLFGLTMLAAALSAVAATWLSR